MMFNTLSPQDSAGLFAALVVLWFALSVACRLALGKPIFASRLADDGFVERWASGRTGSGLMARLSRARNCLHVQVCCGAIHVHPHFPFTLGFVPEIYGMDHIVPLDAVQSATIVGGVFAKAVEVKYLLPDGQAQVLHLLLKNAEGFIRAVAPARSSA